MNTDSRVWILKVVSLWGIWYTLAAKISSLKVSHSLPSRYFEPAPGNWKQGGYIERLPKDPWGGDYQYLSPGVKGEIDVFSLGSDHARGGEGNAADIGNWE
jgi:type II secretion system protein G